MENRTTVDHKSDQGDQEMKNKIKYGQQDFVINGLIIFMAVVALASFVAIVTVK